MINHLKEQEKVKSSAYMSKKIEIVVFKEESSVSVAANKLQHQNTKTENIRFD